MSSVVADGPDDNPMSSRESISPRPTYKSFKKKYNKMRHQFKEKMSASNTDFEHEQKALKLARRLQEQNDQLLNLLLEVNDARRIAPHLRLDLRSPPPPEFRLPALESDRFPSEAYDLDSAHAAYIEAKGDLESGQITFRDYEQIEAVYADAVAATNSFSHLSKLSQTVPECIPVHELPYDIGDAAPTGYLTVEHEEEYLAALDAEIESSIVGIQPALNSHPIRSNGKEKEAQLRNPVSVYTWLRKHQPGVFLQDSDSSPDKIMPKQPSASKPSKKSVLAIKHESDTLDEDGIPVLGPLESVSRSKRKRDDEPYRPKGGSSRPTKKKKVSTGHNGKKAAEVEDF